MTKERLKWWQKEFPNDRDLPLRMFVNGEYHKTFNDISILNFVVDQFKGAGHTVELKYPEGVTDWRTKGESNVKTINKKMVRSNRIRRRIR